MANIKNWVIISRHYILRNVTNKVKYLRSSLYVQNYLCSPATSNPASAIAIQNLDSFKSLKKR